MELNKVLRMEEEFIQSKWTSLICITYNVHENKTKEKDGHLGG
jgi:muramidase (phage lysozyme)